MTREDKEMLLKDLCARLPYGVMCAYEKYDGQLKLICPDGDYCILQNSPYAIETIKPYLRPIYKLTKEELEELEFLTDSDYVDYCNKHHIDYRNLIPKGLALEAPEGMYK